MAKPTLSLQPSEADLAQSANYIDAAYVASARVPEGQEKEWIKRSIREARDRSREIPTNLRLGVTRCVSLSVFCAC